MRAAQRAFGMARLAFPAFDCPLFALLWQCLLFFDNLPHSHVAIKYECVKVRKCVARKYRAFIQHKSIYATFLFGIFVQHILQRVYFVYIFL